MPLGLIYDKSLLLQEWLGAIIQQVFTPGITWNINFCDIFTKGWPWWNISHHAHYDVIVMITWAPIQDTMTLYTLVWVTDNMYNTLSTALTHWGRVTHTCVGNLTIIGPDNGLSPGRRQAIIWTDAGILLIGPWGTNFSEILIGIQTFSFKKMHLKMSSAKWRPFCLGLNVLNNGPISCHKCVKCVR